MVEIKGTYIMEDAVEGFRKNVESEPFGIYIFMKSGLDYHFVWESAAERDGTFLRLVKHMAKYQMNGGKFDPVLVEKG